MEKNYFDEDALKQVVKKLDEYLWNITKNVVCTICHEFFTEPVTTTCGHSFCLNCFKNLLYRVSSSKNTCPLCRHPIKRREANNNHILSKIAKMCYEFPVAFRADVVNLNPALRGIAEELVNNSRISEIMYERNGKNNKKSKTKVVIPKGIDLNDSGSSISGIDSIKMTSETSNLEDSQDLKSVSQLKSKSRVCKSELSEIEKKLKRLGEIPAKQKVDDWLLDVGRDPVSNNFCKSPSVNLENAESSKDGKCASAEENVNEYQLKWFTNGKGNANSSGSLVRIDDEKSEKAKVHVNEKLNAAVSKNEVLSVDGNDPYEFIESQKSGCNVKRKVKRARKKILPMFESIQSFTRDAVKKKSFLISDLDEIKSYPNRSENTSRIKKMRIESAAVSNNASREFCENSIEEISNSIQKTHTEKTDINLCENLNKNSLENKDYDSDESSLIVKRNRLGNVPSLNAVMRKNKSTRIRSKKMIVVSDSSSVNSIDFDESPVSNNKSIKLTTVTTSKHNLSGNKNDPKLESFLDSENAATENLENDDNEKDEIKSNNSSALINNSNCVSPGWSRVSNLKADFKVTDQQNRQSRKSLSISGGEPNFNISKHTAVEEFLEENDREVDYLFNNAKNNANNLYIEDLSQNPDLLLGFDAPNSEDEEKEFKKAVKGVEEELEMILNDLKAPLPHNDENAELKEKENNIVHCTLSQNNVKMTNSTAFPENLALNESSLLNVLESVKHDENNMANNVSATEVKTQNENQDAVPSSNNTDSTVLPKTMNCKNIPFALLGKIKKKRKFSTVFLQLGRLSPHLKRSRSTVVKIVFPKVLHSENRKGCRSNTITVGVQTNLPYAKDNCVEDVKKNFQLQSMACNVPDIMQHIPLVPPSVCHIYKKVEAQIQTSQSFLQTTAKEVQTSQKLELVNAYVQTSENYNEDGLIFSGEKDVSVIPSQIFQDFYSSNFYKKRVNSQCAISTANSSNAEKNNILCVNSKTVNEVFQNESLTVKEVKNGEDKILESEIMDVDFDTNVQHELNKTWITGSQVEARKMELSAADVEILKYQSGGSVTSQSMNTARGEKSVTQSVVTLSSGSKLNVLSKDKDEGMGKGFVSIDDNVDCMQDKNANLAKTCSKLPPRNIQEDGPNVEFSEESDSDIFIEQTPPKFSCTIARDFDAASPRKKEESNANICDKSVVNVKGSEGAKENPTMKSNPDESFLLLSECQIDSQKEKENPVSEANFFIERESVRAGNELLGRNPLENKHSESESANKPPSTIGKEVGHNGENDENNQNQLNSDEKCNDGELATDREDEKNSGNTLSNDRSGLKLSSCKKICIVSSCVSNWENIEKFTKKFGIEHSANPTKEMTHLVVGLHNNDDDELVPFCTPKLLYALANKKWIVTEDWIETCLMFNAIVMEEWFESLDPTGGNACTTARLSTGYLLEKCEVCLLGEFEKITREEFSDLIRDCGGTVVQQPTEFSFSPEKMRMILANGPEMQGDPHIETIMRKYRTAVMSLDVIIVSIQNYKIVNFTPFLLGSATAEELVGWGYSYELVKNDGEGLSDNEKDYGDESESDDGALH